MISVYEENGKLIIELADMFLESKDICNYVPTFKRYNDIDPSDWNVEIRVKNIDHVPSGSRIKNPAMRSETK